MTTNRGNTNEMDLYQNNVNESSNEWEGRSNTSPNNYADTNSRNPDRREESSEETETDDGSDSPNDSRAPHTQ